MSVVVAMKYKDGIAMAADKQCTIGNNTAEVTKVFQTKFSNIGIGTVGSARVANIIEVMDDIVLAEDILNQTPIDRKYIIKYTVPALFKIFKEYGVLGKDDDDLIYFNGELMVCTSTQIHIIYDNGCVVTYDKFASVGCGEQYAQGYLETIDKEPDKITEKEAIKILVDAIAKACKRDPFINDDIDVILLKNI